MSSMLENKFPQSDLFRNRHIGPGEAEKNEMLEFLGYQVGNFFPLFFNIYLATSEN